MWRHGLTHAEAVHAHRETEMDRAEELQEEPGRAASLLPYIRSMYFLPGALRQSAFSRCPDLQQQQEKGDHSRADH